jgi:glutaredoxin
LLDLYSITPAPYVVELDIHPLGAQLQNMLAKRTKRKTVPNVLISGLSIGGGDEVAKLHDEGTIAETIRKMAGKRVTEILRKEEDDLVAKEVRR